MKKSLKRALALLLACTIVIGSVYNTRQKAYASASTIIAGGGAAAVGVEVAFPYLLAITGVVAAGAAGVELYKNRDKIKEWGSAQFGKFKKWVGDNLGEWGWYADAAAAGVAIAKWGDKLGNGTLDKSDPTWSAYKKWVEDDVCTEDGEEAEYNGYPAIGFNVAMPIWDVSISGTGDYIGYMYQSGNKKPTIGYISKSPDMVITTASGSKYRLGTSIEYNGKQYWYTELLVSGITAGTYNNFIGKTSDMSMGDIRNTVASWLDTGVLPWGDTGEKEYTYVGGLAPSLGGAGVLDGDWDVVGVGEKEDEKETKLPWVGSPDLDHTISDVVSGEKTWTDVLDQVGVGVIDRTEEGSKVIDEDGVTTKDWVYADSTTKVPDITIPNEGEVSKELKNYTFAGLEKIFPFCLPFDMIDFIKVLDATPQAPHFKYAFPYPTTSGMKTFEIDIDLSPFDSVAELLRDMECLLFIMGLVLVTRSRMIRG
nr:MAG TPA: hypothetical protein [Inoviridae sp.]